MEIKINAKELRNIINISRKSLGYNRTSQIYSYIKIKTLDNNTCEFTSMNEITSIRISEEVEIIDSGELLVEGNSFFNFINKLRGIVTIKKDGTKVSISSNGATASFSTLNCEEYPKIYEGDLKIVANFNIKEYELKKSIKKCLISISKDVSRPSLNGLCFSFINNTLNLVGCDGYRLSKCNINHKSNHKENMECVLPMESVQLLNDVLKYEENDIEFNFTNNETLNIKNREINISINSLSYEYIKYDKVIPKSTENFIKVSTADIKESLNIVLSTIDKTNTVSLIIKPNDELLKMETRNDIGYCNNSIYCDTNIDNEFRICCKGTYLYDVIKNIEDDEVVIYLGKSTSPILINGNDSLFMIMPMRDNV